MSCELPAIRVFIIDAYRTTLWGLERLIESAGDTMTVAGSATRLHDAIRHMKDTAPSVILFSAICPDADLFEGLPMLSENSKANILVLTSKRDPQLQEKAILAGARGVVDSEGPPDQVLVAIRRVHEGEIWVSRAYVNRLVECARRSIRVADPEQRKIATLTARERQLVAAFMAHPGATAKAIAELLNISAHTARNHLNAVYEKLQVANRVELFDYARRHRMLEASDVIH